MKRNFFAVLAGCFFMVVAFGNAQDVSSARFSEFFSGRVEYSAFIGALDPACIWIAEGLGGSASLTFAAKRDFFVFPRGTYFGIKYNTDLEGSKEPLAKVATVSLGWMNDPNSSFNVVCGVDKLNLHNSSRDALRLHFETRERMWNDPEGIHQLIAIFQMSATSGGNALNGFNARLGIEHELKAVDAGVSLVQYCGSGLDDGSYGRPPAGILTYEIYGKWRIGGAVVKIPYIKAAYCNEGQYGEDQASSRGQKKFGSVSAELAYNFW